MPETKHTTEEYWGSTIAIVTEPQGNGRWRATATVHSPGAAANVAAPLHVQDQPTPEAAATAARSLAAGAIDAQRVTHGKP